MAAHSPRCVIADPEHGGACDTRPESERWEQLFRLMAAGRTDEEILAAIEASAQASWEAVVLDLERRGVVKIQRVTP